MKKVVLVIAFAVAFSFGGMYLQEHQIITHPAYWTFYGFIFGVFSSVILLVVFYDEH